VPTILVVEDEPIVRNFIVNVLTRQGALVFEADSAVEAEIVCGSLRGESIDLLIVAHELPTGSGRDVAARLMERCPNIKVLQLSTDGYGTKEPGGRLLQGSEFLQKPFTAGQLSEAVANILNPRMQ
jgi:DNA-binding response OmpR family regulator